MVTLAISIIIAFIAGFIVALVSVKVGLRWQIGISKGIEPTLNPIAPIVKAVQHDKADKAIQYSADQVKEWLYGKDE